MYGNINLTTPPPMQKDEFELTGEPETSRRPVTTGDDEAQHSVESPDQLELGIHLIGAHHLTDGQPCH